MNTERGLVYQDVFYQYPSGQVCGTQNGILKLVDLESGKEAASTRRNQNYVSDVCVKVSGRTFFPLSIKEKTPCFGREILWLQLIGMVGCQNGVTLGKAITAG